MNQRILNQFGIEKKGFYNGEPFKNAVQDIKNAVKNNTMLAICAAVGAGKTELFKAADGDLSALPDRAPQMVYIRNYFKEKLNIGSILNAIIEDISGESPRRDLEARSRQVVRLLGEFVTQNKRQICIVIEEAHRVHSNTLRAIKELREAQFAGISPLFSVILIGHPQLKTKLRERNEVFWRAQTLELTEANGWMSYTERLRYIRAVYGEALDSTARERVALLCKQPLEMDFYIENKMAEAYKAGYTQLTGETVEMTIREKYERLRTSYQEIAKETADIGQRLGKTTVSEVVHGSNKIEKNVKAVDEALNRLAAKKREQDEGLARSA